MQILDPDTQEAYRIGGIALPILIAAFYVLFLVCFGFMVWQLKKVEGWPVTKIIYCLIPWPVLGKDQLVSTVRSKGN
jgi:hypothetical protein